MKAFGSKMSRIEVDQQWKPRRKRRNRRRPRGPRNMRALSAKIVKLLEDDDDDYLDGRDSPYSVVSFSLSLDDRNGNMQPDSEWIRTAHIKNAALDEDDRRSPLFTGRMLMKNGFFDDIRSRREEEFLHDEFPSEVGGDPITPRLSIRDRLEPLPDVRTQPIEFDIPPRLESPGLDARHRLESSNISIRHRMGPPVAMRSRDPIDFAIAPEAIDFPQDQLDNEPASPLHPRFNRDEYDQDRFSREHLSPQRPHCFRGSLYFPQGYASLPNQDTVRRQRLWPWLKTSDECPENHPEYNESSLRREREDFNAERFARDPYLPNGQRHYEQPRYNHSLGNNPREPRSVMPLSSQQVYSYSNHRLESHEIGSNNRRDGGQLNWSYSHLESYGSDHSPQRFYNSRPLPYQSGPLRNSVMDTPKFRSLIESSSNDWKVPRDRNYYPSYQDSVSDEDFDDSDQQDSETEGSNNNNNNKKRIKDMWKNLIKERGILVARVGETAAMDRECAQYVKNILIEKASDSSKFSNNWKPRFLRTGLVQRSGLYQIICKDYQTLLWTLKQEIPSFKGSEFKMLKRPYDWDCGPVRISMWMYSEPPDPQEALQNLEVENPGIGASTWRLVSVSIEEGWRQFVADVGRESAIYLEINGWTIMYWHHLIPVTRLTNASKQLFINQLAGDHP